jgi:hypothetical protein
MSSEEEYEKGQNRTEMEESGKMKEQWWLKGQSHQLMKYISDSGKLNQ